MSRLKTAPEYHFSKKRLLCLSAILLFCAAVAFGAYYCCVRPAVNTPFAAVSNQEQAEPYGELQKGVTYEQTFKAPANMTGFSVQFSTFQRRNTGTILVRLYDRETGEELYSEKVLCPDIADNSYRRFDLPSTAPQWEGKELVISIESDSGREGNGVAVLECEDTYANGAFFVNGVEEKGDLCFEVYSTGYGFLTGMYACVALLCLVFLLVVYWLLFVRRCALETVLLPSVLFLGLVSMLIFPPFAIPDEFVHFDTAYRYSNVFLLKGYATESGNMLMQAGDVNNGWFVANTDLEAYRTIFRHFFEMQQQTDLVEIPGGDFGNIFQYFPAAIGITLARLLGLGKVLVVYSGRFFNLLFFALASYFGLKKLPFGKSTLFLVALLPMTIHQAASASYDSVVNGLAFLFIGYAMYAVYGKKRMRAWEIVVLCASGAMLSAAKAGVYFVLCLLVLLVLARKDQSRGKKWGLLAVLCGSAFLILLLCNLSKIWGTVTASAAADSADSVQNYTFSFLFTNPKDFLAMLYHTVDRMWQYYLHTMMGQSLGWFNVPVDPLIPVTLEIMLILSTVRKADEPLYIRPSHKLLFLGIPAVVFGSFCLVSLTWTPYGSDWIQGIQGRYFLPILPIALYSLRSKNLTIQKSMDRPLAFGGCIVELMALVSAFGAIVR